MTLEERLTNLEIFVDKYVKSQSNKEFYDDCDKAGLRHTDSLNAEGIAILDDSQKEQDDIIAELLEII